MKRQLKQAGFSVVEAVIIILVVAAVAAVGWVVKSRMDKSSEGGTQSSGQVQAEDGVALIKSIGIDLGDYVQIDKLTQETQNHPFSPYGETMEASSARPNPQPNPQPTFILPLGTKVRSLVDGVVSAVPKLYSDDYSIQVQPKGSKYYYETEHVINPLVKPGDSVKAGQVIAEVSTHDEKYHPGFGLYEIGILVGGSSGRPPSHLCPFKYLDPSIKDDTFTFLKKIMTDWDNHVGEQTYNQAGMPVPGCQILDPVEG
jgi:biotin carboxyl carrier protein